MANSDTVEFRFVELLTRLTEAGKAEWAQSPIEPGFVYCMAGEDLIVFEVRGEKAEHVIPSARVHGVHCKCRNVSYLWLEGLNGWDLLLKLLERAPVGHEAFCEMRRRANLFPLRALQALSVSPG